MQSPTPEGHRSAFAAAFFSAIQPGLGQAYLRRWPRALAWAAPYILLLSFALGVIRSMGSKDFLAQFTDPAWLLGTMLAILLDLAYRLLSALDAYRLAVESEQAPSGPSTRRTASIAGLIAVVLVLVLFHVAVAQPVYVAYDALTSLGSSGPDEPLGTPPPDYASLEPVTTPTASAILGVTPGPTDTPLPTPTQGPDWDGKGRLNILLIGADSGRAGYTGYLTDTLIVASIDPPTGRMALISLPRDTQNIPLPQSWPAYNAYGGVYPSKVNTLYYAAKYAPSLFPGTDKVRPFNAIKGALGELFQLPNGIKYYVAVDLRGFRDVIDTLGGTVIDVQNPVYDTHYPTDDGRAAIKLYIPPGLQYMDGKSALAYARARHATSDFDRAIRQQRVLTSVRSQVDLSTLLAPGVITQLFGELKQSVKTDIPPALFPKLVSLVQKIDFDRRISIVLTPPTYSTECYLQPSCPTLYVLKANVPAIRRAVGNIFTTDPKVEEQRQKIESEAAIVNVLNGTGDSNLKTTKVADALAAQGINATVPPVNAGQADNPNYTTTVITVYNGGEADMPETIDALQKTFGVTVQTAQDAAQTANIVIIVGTQTPIPKTP